MSDHFSVEVGSAPTNSDAGIHSAKACVIRVLGVGGGGGNTLQHMINQSLGGVEFIAVNTDSQALNKSTAPLKVQIGVKLTDGLGAGCDPNKGRKAAEESREDIKKLLQGSRMIFITAGMGGGTGTGAAPIIADIAQETGALTIAVVTKPFRFEGRRHMINAEAGITELSKHVDSLIVIDNEKLLKNLGANISIINAFNEANDVLLNAVKGITDSITAPGYINLDFSDVETIMRGRGHAIIGNGVGQGANFVEDAVQRAIHSPLIDQVDIRSATGLLVNARVNQNFPIGKWAQLNEEIQNYADEEADCKYGIVFDDQLAEDQIVVTILVSGISVNDPNAVESPAAMARTNASMRRNAPADNGFFKQAQNYGGAQAPRGAQPLPRQAVAQGQQIDPRMRMAQQQTQQQPMGAMNPAMAQKAVNQSYDPREVQVTGEANNDDWTEMTEVPAIFRKKV
ncbi:MAG TPA: cell division protein FtsZ [Candidatus Anaerobiospirillum pullistercoris]|uniref:Cell division protein FtsZ n=1 Tax=Candidatus Anaerobiospirillum pullistercoris TaxID=2838452 RepID=A0A9D1WB76_9GAMM|nr:cell division protein FtsZ [Candidatus Anaerobiospirillum pullistercoris]